MARELRPIDISGTPELAELAAEVKATKQPLILRRDGEDLAILSPIEPPKPRQGRPVKKEDALFQLIGIGASDIPGGVSGRKHDYLLEAHRQHRG